MPIEPIEAAAGGLGKEGWLEFDVRWLAGIFGAIATGEAKVIPSTPTMKVHVGIRHPAVPERGAVMHGQAQQAIVPIGLSRKTAETPGA